jgi:hypothetical protein
MKVNLNGNGENNIYRQKFHWGEYLWGYIHTISIIDFENNYEYNKNAIKYLKNVEELIPCESCKKFYIEYIKKLEELDLNKSMILFKWSIDLHNEVNKKLNKKIWAYEDALKHWCKKI